MAEMKITQLDAMNTLIANEDAMKLFDKDVALKFLEIQKALQTKHDKKREKKVDEKKVALGQKVVAEMVASGKRMQLKDWAQTLDACVCADGTRMTGSALKGLLDAVNSDEITRTEHKGKALFGGVDAPNPVD